MLGGGGIDVAEGFQWMAKRSGGGGMLLLGSADDEHHLRAGSKLWKEHHPKDGYNNKIFGLGGVSSVATLILHDRSASLDPFVLSKIN
eukprot:COSAG05_NODE_13973_length_412_cov_0.968051_1_plen_87_part_01